MQLINVELISDAERQDGDGKCKITIRCADGTEQTLYARELPGNDVADDCFLAKLIGSGESCPADATVTPSHSATPVIIQFHHPSSGRMPRATFYPRA